jgi:xanthine dehydrogenase accessory factor
LEGVGARTGGRQAAAIWAEAVAAAAGGPPVAVATLVRVPAGGLSPGGRILGAKMLVRPDGSRLGDLGGGPFEEAVAADALAALSAVRRAAVQAFYYTGGGERVRRLVAQPDAAYQVMLEVVQAKPVLLVVGAGHIGQSLTRLGEHVGFSVAVVDDRPDFASRERLPEADRILCGDLVESLRGFPIDSNTCVVLVSRGHKQDELALREVVTSSARGGPGSGGDAAYVGMIGSRRRVGTVLQHLADGGFPRDALERVRTPIGLDIGAETPEEIAVSIIAEIIQTRRGGTGEPMHERR